MGAQAFASAGFFVLQVEDKPFSEDQQELKTFAEGYRSGIESLVDDGLVDPDRVGLIAFSRTGVYALQLLATYPKLLRALTIADSFQIGYMAQLLRTNVSPDLASQADRLAGGAADLTGGRWFARNPTYQIER